MKFYIAVSFTILAVELFGQDIDSLGIDDSPLLNRSESTYFNIEFKDASSTFDFTGKKVAFVTGSSATKHLTKAEYFEDVKARSNTSNGMIHFPILLTEEEKLHSGGYDVVVMSWVKVLTNKRRGKIIRELNAASHKRE